ncbi:MAG: hypothetical protein JWR39_2441 [Devosia sp.]|jgi:hypothetical protein|nr:hypothetical protein [Devosia sp.]
MTQTYDLAREHLRRAAAMLQGGDRQSRQLRQIVERTITLIDDLVQETPVWPTNVLDLQTFRERREGL